MKLYKIYFEVDNGCAYIMDYALIYATNSEEAVNKLSEFIIAQDFESRVSDVVYIKEFSDDIFTTKFGYK